MTDEELNEKIWGIVEEVYSETMYKDHHAELGERLGIPRVKAKEAFYQVIYGIPLPKDVLEKIKEKLCAD